MIPLLASLLACGGPLDLGPFQVEVDPEGSSFTVHAGTSTLEGVRIAAGTGSAQVQMALGSFRFDEVEEDLVEAASVVADHDAEGLAILAFYDDGGQRLGDLVLTDGGCGTQGTGCLGLSWSPSGAANRMRLSADCGADEHFLGLGAHAWDVDHVGEAFSLWVSEPGVGKSDTDQLPDDWSMTGTRHSSSYPVPFLLRPHLSQGLAAWTPARVDVDLCATDPQRFSLTAWEGPVDLSLIQGSSPLDTVERLTDHTGRPDLPPAWTFAPWNDAVHGSEEVRATAAALRSAGAPSSALWTEDWKGGETSFSGYHLKGEWFLDTELYPDAAELDSELEAQGFQWLAYFAPFLVEDTLTWDDALEAGVILSDGEGAPYTFTGVTLKDTALVDLSTDAGWEWALGWLESALDAGFDGWMADYGEWMPTDAAPASGEDALDTHNLYPVRWQALNREATRDRDAVFFSRSGWMGAQGQAPVVWAGDQRTSFDVDDGLPTLLPMGLGLAASGVPIFSHDIAGYQSIGNSPSTRELWFRWAALGAFTPVMRTHHGAFDDANWRFDSDEETLQFWVRMAREHTRLFPYLYGLAARAHDQGTPMILPTSFLFEGEPWDRTDAWMLGPALLVAPVLEEGALARDVDLPAAVAWFDWWTGSPASSGTVQAPLDHIPVFAASGTVVPTLAQIPDTLLKDPTSPLVTLDEADGSRVVLVFGSGGSFTEADGTTYTTEGCPTGEASDTLATGQVSMGGGSLQIDGPWERTYQVIANCG